MRLYELDFPTDSGVIARKLCGPQVPSPNRQLTGWRFGEGVAEREGPNSTCGAAGAE